MIISIKRLKPSWSIQKFRDKLLTLINIIVSLLIRKTFRTIYSNKRKIRRIISLDCSLLKKIIQSIQSRKSLHITTFQQMKVYFSKSNTYKMMISTILQNIAPLNSQLFAPPESKLWSYLREERTASIIAASILSSSWRFQARSQGITGDARYAMNQQVRYRLIH